MVILIVLTVLGFAAVAGWVGIRELRKDRELATRFNRAVDKVMHEE